jgi:hypothetical protein
MFDWIPNLLITIALEFLMVAVVCTLLGFGLCYYLRHRRDKMRSVAAYDACEEPPDDDAVARRLLNY